MMDVEVIEKHEIKNRIKIIKGDITELKIDAIVNAANNTLLGGSGVDGAIHKKAGEELLKECQELNGCKTGEAKITKGYNLPADYIIHTVGPIWEGGNHKEEELLEECYMNSLNLALEHGLKKLAFPSISTGAYGYPVEEASHIALTTVINILEIYGEDLIEKVFFVCFNDEVYNTYKIALEKIYKEFEERLS